MSPPYFSELLGPSLTMNLAQLVSPSVALPAELVGISVEEQKRSCLKTNSLAVLSFARYSFFQTN